MNVLLVLLAGKKYHITEEFVWLLAFCGLSGMKLAFLDNHLYI